MSSKTATEQQHKNSFSKNNLPAEIRDNLDKETLEKLESGELEVRRKEVKIDAKQMTVEEEDGTYYLTVPVSGLADDRDGDDFSEDGLQRTVEQLASEKVPFYFDHGLSKETGWVEYSVLDMRGKWVDGYQEEDQVFGKVKLRNDEFVEDEIEEFVSLHKQEMPVGYSVGFIPTEYEEKERGGMTVHDHDLLEVSGVGIPSQPDSVTQSAGMAIAKGLQDSGMELGEKEFNEEKIVEGVKNAMTEKEQDSQELQEDGKSEEQNVEKQIDSEDVEAIMEVVSAKVNEHLQVAMDDAEDEIMSMIDEEETDEDTEEEGEYGDDEEEETDGAHGDEEDDEEMNQDDASDQNEESEKDSAESEQEEKGLSEDEKTQKNNNQTDNTINTIDENKESEETEEEKSGTIDPFRKTEESKA